MKRRIMSFLFLFILLAPVFVSYFWLQYQKSMVKHEVKWRIIDGIDKDKLVVLKFSKSEFQKNLHWKHTKEFEYNFKMYDIVESMIIKDSVYYYCWYDNEETKLNHQLTELVSKAYNSNPLKNESQKKIYSFFKNLYFSNAFDWKMMPQKTEKRTKSIFLVSFTSINFPPPTPPPQFS